MRHGYPALAREIERVLEQLQTRVPHNERLVPCHGAFRHKQLVGNDQYLTLLDWDGLILANPAWTPPASLPTAPHADYRAGQGQQTGMLAEVFRREFRAREPEVSLRAGTV